MRRYLFLVLLWGTLGTVAGVAQPASFSVSLVSADTLRTEIGRPISVRVRVENLSADTLSFSERLAVPSGWTALPDVDAFRLAPGVSTVRFASVLLPRVGEAGDFPVQYGLQAGGETAEISVTIQTEPVYDVEFQLESSPAYTVAGTPYAPAYVIENRGNVPTTVGLWVQSPPSPLDRSASPDSVLTLQPREVARFQASIGTRDDAASPYNLSVRTYLALTDSDAIPLQWESSSTTVLPLLSAGGFDYQRFPVEVGVSAGVVEGAGISGGARPYPFVQAYASGQGPLNSAATKSASFSLRTPYLSEGTLTAASTDYYQATYQDSTLYALGGDGGYRFSELLYTYGFGSAARARVGRAAASAAFFTDRFGGGPFRGLDQRETSWAGAVGYGEGTPVAIQGGALRRTGIVDGTAGSVHTSIVASPSTDGHVELAYGGRDGGDAGLSYSAGGRTRVGPLTLGASAYDLNAAFPTLGGNQFAAFSSASVQTGGVGVSANVSYSEVGLVSRDSVGPRDRDAFRLQLRTSLSRALSATYRRAVRSDRSLGFARTRGEDIGEVSLRSRFGAFNVRTRALAGRAYYRPFSDDRFVTGGGLSANVQATDWMNVGIDGSYVRGRAIAIDPEVTSETYSGGVTVLAVPSERLSFRLRGYGSVIDVGPMSSSLAFQANSAYLLPWGHRFELSAEYSKYALSSFQGGTGYLTAFATYAVPLSIRTARRTDTGLVEGRVRRVDGERVVSGVPILLESEGALQGGAITDERGRFYISSVPVNDYAVRLAPGALHEDEVLVGPDRTPVRVAGGEKAAVELQVAPASSLQVTARVVPPGTDTVEDPRQQGAGGTVGLAFELTHTQTGETYRGYTGLGGTVEFRRLRPGLHTLSFADDPQGTMVSAAADSMWVRVGAGEAPAVQFGVRRIARPVVFASSEPVRVGRIVVPDDVGTVPYVIKPGDWLSKLALERYGDASAWEAIYEQNRDRIKNPNRIFPGWRIVIPKRASR